MNQNIKMITMKNTIKSTEMNTMARMTMMKRNMEKRKTVKIKQVVMASNLKYVHFSSKVNVNMVINVSSYTRKKLQDY